ncbi:unnamed protein product [Fusarium graminearum]|nr:unnamed protein product [Fusarium graminearum]CAG2008974.1 unnamed protein product [Fusarium graminearum]
MDLATSVTSTQPTSFLGKVVEICIVTPDCKKTISELTKLGIGPFRIFEFNANTVSDRYFRGQPAEFELLVAFADTGDMVWEIMQPVSGPSLMQEFLHKGGQGIHHVAFDCNHVPQQQRKDEFKRRGFEVAQSGIWHGKKGTFSKSEIRLVSFKTSGSDGQQLEASIKNVELDPDHPITYTALSYCWGIAVERIEVPCDGEMLSITSSLHEALVEITKSRQNEALWIDQICINQEDMDEKSEQVSKMNMIYDKAETVLAWLGPAVYNTELAIDFVKKVGDVALPTATDMFRWDSYGEAHEETKLERTEELTNEQSGELGLPFDDDNSWTAFVDFFDRPWYQRMWTVQEIIQARKAIVQCGPHSLPWEHVSAAARWYIYKAGAIRQDYPREVDGARLVTQMTTIAWRTKMGSEYYRELFNQEARPSCRWGMRDLLENLRPRLATDPRDKVFALLGISDIDRELWDDRGMTVNYSKSVEDVFTQATDEIIKSDTSDLNVIWSARQRNDEAEWPSWVPDWRLETGTGCAWGIGAPLKTEGKPNGEHVYIPTTEPRSLAVKGKVIGRVTYKNEYRHFGELFRDSHLREVYNACMERLSVYPTGEDVKTAFGLTLIGGLPFPATLQKKETSVETYAAMYMQFYDNTQMPMGTAEEKAKRDEALAETYKVGLDMTWLQAVLAAYCERRFIVTDSGHMGLAHHQVLEGDVIAVVMGLEWPCVLRPKSNGEKHDQGYEFIGDAYCHGVMNGEAIEGIISGNDEGQVFTLR